MSKTNNRYKRWTKEEERRAYELATEGKSDKTIGDILGRSKFAIRSKLSKIRNETTLNPPTPKERETIRKERSLNTHYNDDSDGEYILMTKREVVNLLNHGTVLNKLIIIKVIEVIVLLGMALIILKAVT